MINIKLKEIIEDSKGILISGDKEGLEDIYIKNVVIDGRESTLNSLYVVNVTDNFDGHEFIDQAFENNAIAVFINHELDKYNPSKYYILVKNINEALFEIAKAHRKKFNVKTIGITGSVGKTTFKEMIAQVLSKKYSVYKTPGNYNSEKGVPITILGIEKEHEFAVCEMGIDHEGEMDILEDIVRPDEVVFGNVGVSHIEKLKTSENIFLEKIKICKNVNKKENIYLNIDSDSLYKYYTKHFKKDSAIWFGMNSLADVKIENITIGEDTINFDLEYENKKTNLSVLGLSKHLVYPATVSFLIGLKYNVNIEDIKEALLNFKPLEMRMNIVKLKENILLLDDTYNASPDSMCSAIETLGGTNKLNKIAILGDMLELGEDEFKLHVDLKVDLIKNNIQTVILYGTRMRELQKELLKEKNINVFYFDSKEDIYGLLEDIVKENTSILVKASRGLTLEDVSNYLIEKFK